MISINLDQIAAELDLRRYADTLWGSFGLIPCCMTAEGDQLIIEIVFSGKIGAARETMGQTLEDVQQAGGISRYTWNPEGRLLLLYHSAENFGLIPSLVQKIGNQAMILGLELGCSECAKPGESIPCSLASRVVQLCPGCLEKKAADWADYQKPQRYIYGGLGALFGALIGSIVWIIIGALGFYAAIGGLAIAWASVKGYTLVKGPLMSFRLPIIIVSMIISLVFAEYVGLVIALLRDESVIAAGLDLGQVMAIIPEILANPEVIQEMLPNLGLGLVFAGLGAFGILRKMADAEAPIQIQRLDTTE
jgi:hypothetical protein